jgi:hypothetical protein
MARLLLLATSVTKLRAGRSPYSRRAAGKFDSIADFISMPPDDQMKTAARALGGTSLVAGRRVPRSASVPGFRCGSMGMGCRNGRPQRVGAEKARIKYTLPERNAFGDLVFVPMARFW